MDVWKLVEDGYEFPKSTIDDSEGIDEWKTSRTVSIDPENRIQYEWNALANNVILCLLYDDEFTKVMKCTTTKQV